MMNKPSWDNAPEWANYLAMDCDGTWYWYEKEPRKDQAGQWMERHAGMIEAAFLPFNWWDKSLETRPE